MTRMRLNALATVAVLAVSVTACGQGVDRLGDEPADPVTLSAAFGYSLDEIGPFVREVALLSDGQLVLDLPEPPKRTEFHDHALIDRVREGAVDVAIVPTRDWAAYGVHAYDALLAPFLVDSLDLQQKVFADHVLDEGLAAALDELGLVHVGLIEGGLRRPAAHPGPLLAPEDFAGMRLATSGSAVADAALSALGAVPVPLIVGEPLEEVDAMEGQMTAIINNGYEATLPHITDNLVLWPRSDAVVVNKARFDGLTADQQGWLRAAADTSREANVTIKKGLEDEAVGRACRGGITFAHASDAQRAALRAAVQPVYDDLRADPATSRAIDAIEAMRDASPRELKCDLGGVPDPAAGVATEIDGAWRACPTVDDIVAAGGTRPEGLENAGCHTMVLDRGAYGPGGSGGTYEVNGNQLVILQANNELFEFTWSLYDGKLTLDVPANEKALSPAPQRAVAYERLDD